MIFLSSYHFGNGMDGVLLSWLKHTVSIWVKHNIGALDIRWFLFFGFVLYVPSENEQYEWEPNSLSWIESIEFTWKIYTLEHFIINNYPSASEFSQSITKYARLWPGHWASPSYHIQHHTSNILYRRKSKETWSPIHFSVVVLFCFCHFIVFCGKFVSSVNMKHILQWPNDKIMRKFLLLYVECCIDFINCPKRLAFCSLSFYPCRAPILPPQILCVYDVFTL